MGIDLESLSSAVKVNNKIRSEYKDLDSRESEQNVSFDDKIWRNCPGGEIGRHKGLKIPRRKLRAGSSPALGTILLNNEILVCSNLQN